MTDFDAVGWILVAGLAAAMLYLALKRAWSIVIEPDGVRTRGLVRWSDQEHFLFADIRRFDERYWRPPLTGGDQGRWRLYAVTVEGDCETRHELPNWDSSTFSRLKRALADWQTAHGCLQPLPLADLSEKIRY
jgi:hypothetical protein